MDAEPVVAAAVAEPEPPNPVHEVLTICGIASAANRETFINIEGLDSMEAFASMNGDSDVSEMAKRMASRPTATGDHVGSNGEKESDHNLDKVDIDIIDPGKCQTDAGWDNWQIGFVNKLSAIMGAAKVPIDYVVRPEWDYTDELFLDDDEMRRFQMPLEGENFKRDNKLVFQILKSACIKSDAWTWIQSYDRTANGRTHGWRLLRITMARES
ncbi:hypothetical protein MHU86_5185 [Fragilaria crotonensis]|nr:hypothetical protein MHU86_5185 [Fragilaria crotonensis]